MVNTYPSQRDGWIVGLIWLSIAAQLVGFAVIWLSVGPLLPRVLTSALLLVCALFTLHLLLSTAYDVGDDLLVVRCGILRWKVPVDAILSVKPSHSLLSGPALSLDRLHVRYNGSRMGVLISPVDQAAFLSDLASRSSKLGWENGAIVRDDDAG